MTLTRTLTTAGAKPSRIRQDRRPMTLKRFLRKYLLGVIAILASIVVFIVPFAFIFLTAAKNMQEASLFEFSLPQQGWHLWENFLTVLQTRDFIIVRAFVNSTILTVASFASSIIAIGLPTFSLRPTTTAWRPAVSMLLRMSNC